MAATNVRKIMTVKKVNRRNTIVKVIDWLGAKHVLASWITSYFPPHECYIEPFAGSAAVLFNKPIAKVEILNDLDGNVINFFRVLRDKPYELQAMLELTPWAIDEFRDCVENPNVGDDVERARRFFVRCNQAVSPGGRSWSRVTQLRSSKSQTAIDRTGATHLIISRIPFVANRLKLVQIDNEDVVVVMKKYDHPKALFYLDPPYVRTTRTSGKKYNHDFIDEDHHRLAEIAKTRKGFVIISGYPSALYDELFADWEMVTKDNVVTQGGHKRVEALWLSPRVSEWYHKKFRQISF